MAHRWALSVSSPGGPLGPYGVRAEQCTSGVAGVPMMGPRGPLRSGLRVQGATLVSCCVNGCAEDSDLIGHGGLWVVGCGF